MVAPYTLNLAGQQVDTDPPMPEMDPEERTQVLDILGTRLQAHFDRVVAQRRETEDRWLEDLRQYLGQYDPHVLAQIKEAEGSEAFVNITRPKCDTLSARISDLLLPTDDENWDIEPTPMPDLPAELMQAIVGDPQTGQPVTAQSGEPVRGQDLYEGIKAAAKDACDKMRRRMQDSLAEAEYNGVQRRIIDDAVIYGIGVLKGPIPTSKTQTRWKAREGGLFVVESVQQLKPDVDRVNPFDFFPDMSSPDPEGWEFVFQRHYASRKQLRKMAKRLRFIPEQVRRLLEMPRDHQPSRTANHLAELREMQQLQAADDNRYEILEYHGVLDKNELCACGIQLPDDALVEAEGIVWFCDGVVLKAALQPLETDELPYSVFRLVRDQTSPFPPGAVRLMRHSQRMANAAIRMILDNAGLSVAGQLVVNDEIVRPADGSWTMKPRKTWLLTDPARRPDEAFYLFQIPSNIEQLLAVFNLAMRLADDELALPLIAQGTQSPSITKTAEGMSILMNSANTVLRRVIRNYDDDVTRTFLPRLYDWHMQMDEDESIKGDMEIVARGSSALMEKEKQTQALSSVAGLVMNPAFAAQVDSTEWLRQLFKSMRVDGIVREDDEIAKLQQQMAQQAQQQGEPEKDMGERQFAIEQGKLQLSEMKLSLDAEALREEVIAKARELAAKVQMNERDVLAQLGLTKLKEDQANARMNAEMQAKYAFGTGI